MVHTIFMTSTLLKLVLCVLTWGVASIKHILVWLSALEGLFCAPTEEHLGAALSVRPFVCPSVFLLSGTYLCIYQRYQQGTL